MIIYNVTIKIATAIQVEWLGWLRTTHVPGVLATGCFTKADILQLLETDDADGPTYAIQFKAESKAHYHRYIEQFSAEAFAQSVFRWGDQFITFSSVLEVVD